MKKKLTGNHLVPATPKDFEDLKKLLYDKSGQKTELGRLLTTTAKEFRKSKDKNLKKYLYVIEELTEVDTMTLLDIIEVSMDWNMFGNKIYSFFAENDKNELVGFAAYVVVERIVEVEEVIIIKTFSFNSKEKDNALLKDLLNLLRELKTKYKRIHWAALKGNPANRGYRFAIEKFKGKSWNDKDDDNIIHYRIEGKPIV
jgi:hypothetical protein